MARVGGVLRALAQAPDGLSLSELALAVDMPKSTVHRLVAALETEEFVTPARAGKVHLGRGIARRAEIPRPPKEGGSDDITFGSRLQLKLFC